MTPLQRTLFFRLFAKACATRGIPTAEREAYRHRLIAHACPVSGGSLRNVGSGEDFDRLMREVAREAQAFEAAVHFATSEARRIAKLCEACARQIFEIAEVSGGDAVAYLQGLIAQAGWKWALFAQGGEWWLDLTRPHAQKLFQMLDTHRRRLLRRVATKWELTDNGAERSMRLAFRANGHYEWRAAALWFRPWKQEGPEPRRTPLCVRVREPSHFPSPPGGARTKTPAVARSRAALQSRRNRPPLSPLERT